MPKFRITAPTGEVFDVDAPEGATEDDAISYVQQNMAPQQATITPNQSSPQEEPSFLQEMKNNAKNAVSSAADLWSGNYQDIGRSLPTPRTEALGDKLFPQGSEGTFMDAVRNLGNTNPSDWSGALLEKFGETPEGKALAVIGGLNPIYNAAGTAYNRYVVPGVSEVTGIAPENIQLATLLAGTTGLNKAGQIKDPNIAALNYLKNRVSGDVPSMSTFLRDQGSGVGPSTLDTLKQAYAKPPATPAQTAMDKVYAKLAEQYKDPAELQKAINSYGASSGKALIEQGGEGVQRLGEGAAQFEKGGNVASEYFGDKLSVAPETMKQSIYKNVAPNVNYLDEVDKIVAEGRKTASPYYTKAFKSNQAVMSPVIRNILNTPQGRSALKEAVADMQNEMVNPAKADPGLTAAARDLQNIDAMDATPGGVASGLKLQTLDYVKRGFDQAIRKAKYGQNADMAEVSRLNYQRAQLVNELDRLDKTGAYAKARSTASDYISARDAAETGLGILKMDREELGRTFNSYSPADKKAFRVGVMKALREHIDNTTRMTPDNQAALGRNVAAFLQNKTTRNKLQIVLSPREYDNVVKTAQATDNLYLLRNRTLSNSPSARRLASMAEFDSATADAALQIAQKGATRALSDQVIGAIASKFRGMSDETAGEVAKILFETDAKKKYQIVRQLTNIANGKTSQARIAQQKLGAFWGMFDAMAARRGQLAPVEAGQPLKITIQPQQELPPVNLPSLDPQSFNSLLQRFYA